MQRLEVSCAVRHIHRVRKRLYPYFCIFLKVQSFSDTLYIYVVRRQRVNYNTIISSECILVNQTSTHLLQNKFFFSIKCLIIEFSQYLKKNISASKTKIGYTMAKPFEGLYNST